jgi:hypothetical protein
MKKISLLLPLTLLISACAGVAPDSLKAVAGDKSIVLANPVQYDEEYSMAGNHFFYTISAGKYAAKYEDAKGTYYEGAAPCFTIRIEMASLKKDGKAQPTPMIYRCGIFMPGLATAEPKLYFYKDAGVSKEIFENSKWVARDANGKPATGAAALSSTNVGASIAAVFDAAELKNLHFYQDQPKAGQLRQAVQ